MNAAPQRAAFILKILQLSAQHTKRPPRALHQLPLRDLTHDAIKLIALRPHGDDDSLWLGIFRMGHRRHDRQYFARK